VTRFAHTGISKKLRDYFLDDAVFVDLLERVETEIAEAMEDVLRAWERRRRSSKVRGDGVGDVDGELDECKDVESEGVQWREGKTNEGRCCELARSV